MAAITHDGYIIGGGTPTTADQVAYRDSSVGGSLDKIQSDLGAFEVGNTAAYSHRCGEFFVWKGQFVKVLATIAVGASLVLGTNIQATSVSDMLTQANRAASCSYNRGENITKYVTDGTLRDRIAGTNGFEPYEDIFPWDYIDLGTPITCTTSGGGASTGGSQVIRVAQRGGLNSYQYNGNCLIMVPETGFGSSYMNSSNTTVGGYYNSFMHQTIMADLNTKLGNSIIGSYLKETNELLSNGINASGYNRFGTNSGCASSWAWYLCKCVLMSEIEVDGSITWSSSGHDTGSACHQLEAFRNDKLAAIPNYTFWKKDVASSSLFSRATDVGAAADTSAIRVYGVRPRFTIA